MQTVTDRDALARFGCALSDPTRVEILMLLRDGPGYPSDLADTIGVSRQILSNHLACLRGCGLVVTEPEGRRSRYELADSRIAHALNDLLGLVLAVDPACCPAADTDELLLMAVPRAKATGGRRWPAGSGCSSPRPSPTTSSRRWSPSRRVPGRRRQRSSDSAWTP